MPAQRVKEFLDKQGVRYVVTTHSPAYTAQEIAASAHITGKKMAKSVILKVDGKIAMAVMPANEVVQLDRFKRAVGADRVELATEEEFKDLFPTCEIGAMPPFGNFFGMSVFVSPDLKQYDEIAFNAGNHRELITMSYDDFQRLVQPKELDFAAPYERQDSGNKA